MQGMMHPKSIHIFSGNNIYLIVPLPIQLLQTSQLLLLHLRQTRKIRIDEMSSTEIEREISAVEFDSLAGNILSGTRPISKTRYTFIYKNQLFEIDVYPEWKRTAIMETELDSRERTFDFPEFIEIVKDVTGDKSYSNRGMSHIFPKEQL